MSFVLSDKTERGDRAMPMYTVLFTPDSELFSASAPWEQGAMCP